MKHKIKNRILSTFNFQLSTRDASRGVTLIEMLVVVAIIGVISSILLFNYSDFSSNVSVRNLSQEIALSIRKAQTYATSVRSIEGTIVSSDRYDGYGISFASGATLQADDNLPDAKTFVLFADVPNGGIQTADGVYGGQNSGDPCGTPSSAQAECIEAFTISTADHIVGICGQTDLYNVPYDSARYDDCGEDQSHTADISFIRPSPDARILVDGRPSSYAKIVLASPKGLRRSITVWNTGQISTQ